MKKPARLDGKKKLVSFNAKMEKDMNLYCRRCGIKSASELIREAVAAYIYATPNQRAVNLQNMGELCVRIESLENTLNRIFNT